MATEGEVTTVDVGVSDADLFNEANAETETPVEVEAEQPADDGPARDEQGRFAAKTEAEPKAEAVAEPAKEPAVDEDKGGQVPSWRVREINAEKAELAKNLEAERAERTRLSQQFEAVQREIQTLRRPAEQPKEQKPDPLIDPEGYERYMENKFEQRLLTERRELSLAQAHRTYKNDFSEAFTAAQQALAQGDPALTARLQQSRDPGETLMEWHRQRKIMAEVGNDPNVFFDNRLKQYLSDPANQAKVLEQIRGAATTAASTQQRPNVKLPPTLSSMSPAASARGDDDDSDLSDEALFRHSIR